MEKKYIIELEDKSFHKEDGDFLYRVKGFNSLVFDMTGISKLTPYTEPDLEKVKKEAYEEVYESGFVAGHLKAKKSGQKFYEDGYKRGLVDAWEAASTIVKMSWKDKNKIFGKMNLLSNIFLDYTPDEAIEKIRQYEQEKEEIIDPDKNKVEALANDIGIHKLFALVKEIRGE